MSIKLGAHHTEYSPDRWNEEPYMGRLLYNDDNKEYYLSFSHYTGLGFSLSFTLTAFGEGKSHILEAWQSISNIDKRFYFVDVYSDCLMSVATFIKPLETFEFLKAFMQNPTNFLQMVMNSKLMIKAEHIPIHPINGGTLPEGIAECYHLNPKTNALEPIYPRGTLDTEKDISNVPLF